MHKLSLEILALHENGDMEDLDKNWILLNITNCVTKDSSPSTLGLTNMAGTKFKNKQFFRFLDFNFKNMFRCLYVSRWRSNCWNIFDFC